MRNMQKALKQKVNEKIMAQEICHQFAPLYSEFGLNFFENEIDDQTFGQLYQAAKSSPTHTTLKIEILRSKVKYKSIYEKLMDNYTFEKDAYYGFNIFQSCLESAFSMAEAKRDENGNMDEALSRDHWLYKEPCPRNEAHNPLFINKYLLQELRSYFADRTIRYFRKNGYKIKRIERKIDGTFYFKVEW